MLVERPAWNDTVGRTIRLQRKRKGVFIPELARAIGVSSATVSRWERGREFCPFDRREQIATELGFEPALLGEPTAVELSAEEASLFAAYRRLTAADQAALRSLAIQSSSQERAPC